MTQSLTWDWARDLPHSEDIDRVVDFSSSQNNHRFYNNNVFYYRIIANVLQKYVFLIKCHIQWIMSKNEKKCLWVFNDLFNDLFSNILVGGQKKD